MLDLGATICVAREPRCDRCPARRWCAWAEAGRPAPDPAIGSAGVAGRQSRFEGSDRQGRGRLLDALRAGPVAQADVAVRCGWPDDPDRAARIADQLIAEGFAASSPGWLRLR
jgi:A/G-specific adenine glycosylase